MTATIVATPEPNATPPRVRLDITSDQPTITPFRVAQDGTRTAVRTYDGGPLPVSGGSALLYDTEVAFELPVSYTANGSGVTSSAAVTVNPTQAWLVHPGVPGLSRPIKVWGISSRTRAANQAVRYPLNAKFPIVAGDGQRKAAAYNLTLRTETLSELEFLTALLDDCATLLLNIPPSKGWGVTCEYVSVGDLVEDREVDWGAWTYRQWQLPCTVTGRPAGGTQSDNTYGKSFALYPTYAARFAAHATYRQAFDPTP